MPVVLVGVRVPVQLPPDAAGRMSTPAADGGAGRSVSSGREGDVVGVSGVMHRMGA